MHLVVCGLTSFFLCSVSFNVTSLTQKYHKICGTSGTSPDNVNCRCIFYKKYRFRHQIAFITKDIIMFNVISCMFGQAMSTSFHDAQTNTHHLSFHFWVWIRIKVYINLETLMTRPFDGIESRLFSSWEYIGLIWFQIELLHMI